MPTCNYSVLQVLREKENHLPRYFLVVCQFDGFNFVALVRWGKHYLIILVEQRDARYHKHSSIILSLFYEADLHLSESLPSLRDIKPVQIAAPFRKVIMLIAKDQPVFPIRAISLVLDSCENDVLLLLVSQLFQALSWRIENGFTFTFRKPESN